MTERHHEDVQ